MPMMSAHSMVQTSTRCVVLATSRLHNNLDVFLCNSPAEGNTPFLHSAQLEGAQPR